MKNKVLAISAIACFLTTSTHILAHHSPSVFDQTKTITVTGSVTKFDFINPHVIVHFDVENDTGDVEQWAATGGPPNAMAREGWRQGFIKTGEKLTISGYQYRDGRKIMHLQTVIRVSTGEVIRSRQAP